MPDLLEKPELVTSEAPRPGVSPGEVAQPYEELSRTLGKAGEAAEAGASNLATRAGYQAVTTDEHGNVQIQKAPIIGPASNDYERVVKMAALAQGEGVAKDADIKLRQQFPDNPDQYLAAANSYKNTVMKKYADLGVPEVGIALGRAIDSTTTYNYRALSNEKRELDLRTAEKDVKDGRTDAHDTLVALARSGQLNDLNDPTNMSAPAQQALGKWRSLTDQLVNHTPGSTYSQKQADYDAEQLSSDVRANGLAHHFVDDVYKGSDNPSTAAATALNAARSILTDPTMNLKDAERHRIYNFISTEIRSEDALRRGDANDARQTGETILDGLRLGGNPSDYAESAGNVIDTLKRTGYPGEASRFLSREKIILKGGSEYGSQPLATQDQQRQVFNGGVVPSSAAEARLIQHESSGDPTQVNRLGYAGLYQFGAPLLKDLGLYTPGANENLENWSRTSKFAAGKWSGTFNIPGFPDVKTLQDFRNNPAAQKAAFDIHTQNMDQQISTLGLDKYEGQTVGGVPITRAGLHAMIHLAGAEGARVTLQTGGRIQPRDENGTGPLQYAAEAAHAEMSSPAANLFLQVANSTTDQRDLRAEWKAVKDDFQKTRVPPSDRVINDFAERANHTDDFALNAQIGRDVALMKIERGYAGMSLAQQDAQRTEFVSRGASGDVGAGYGEVNQALTEITTKIREGLDKDPISTAVSYSRGKLPTPAPLDFSDPQKLAAGLQQRVPIARWANQTWQGKPVAALDQGDVDAVKAQLANPDPAAKAQIYGAIATLPADLRGPTLKKIAGDNPVNLAEAAAGSMMRTAPDIATSIFQGLAAMQGGKGDVTKAFGPEGRTDFTKDLSAKLPATVFPVAGRTDPTGDYATMGEMVRARYAYLSAQSGNTDYSADRVNKAVDDVTGGVLSLNGGKFIAPARGMTQPQLDGVLDGLTDRDLAGVTDLSGRQISAAYLRAGARLESVGDGRYLVNFSKGQDKPIYAFRYTNTESPSPFVLDLRGRQPGPSLSAPPFVGP